MFIILAKAKGMYVVQRDPDGLGKILPNGEKSGWVPAGMSFFESQLGNSNLPGCLLETSQPISIASPGIGAVIPPYPGLAPLPPSAILSSFYPGIVLMDYVKQGDDEITLVEGEKVRIYKKYWHWNYT
jgi:hypothetical protein